MRWILTLGFLIVVGVTAAPSAGAPAARAQEARNFLPFLNCVNAVAPETGAVVHTSVAASFWIPRRADLPAGSQQLWVDLSLFNNNFAHGTFLGAGPFAPTDQTQQFDWEGLVPARRHYYRLNALTADGWFEVGRGEFDTPDCRNVGNFQCETDGDLRVVFLLDDAPDGRFGEHSFAPQSQWIDLSLLNNNFAPGTFIGAGPFPARDPGPFRASFEWEGIIASRVHYYRVNIHYGSVNWREYARGSFFSLDCRGLPSPAPPFHGD
jgi:hypothetical protein